MASGLRNLLVRIGADASQMKTEMKKSQNTLTGFKKNISGTSKGIGVATASVGASVAGVAASVGLAVAGIAAASVTMVPATQDAMRFEAMMGTLSESLGKSMNDFVKWQDTVGRSLGFSKLQSAELANTLSLNFKQMATSQADLLSKTTEMMRVAAVISSKRGMSMTEVSDRIRSAMNQEADGADELGVNVRAGAIMQSEAYKQMANGKPWADLSTNMQKTILYHHILQQVSQNLGIEVADNTAMRMNVFKASLLDARLALGQAFLPALNAVLPYLTAFANRVTRALNAVASFMQALFGNKKKVKDATKTFQIQSTTTDKQTKSVGKLGDQFTRTGKKVKKAVDTMKSTLAGFDALNILSFGMANTPDPGTGGGGGSDGGGIDDGGINNPIPPGGGDPPDNGSKWQEWANKIKGYLASLKPEWDNLVEGAKTFWQGLVDIWNTPFIQDLKNNVLDGAMTLFRIAIDLVADSLAIIGDSFSIVADILNGNWSKAWEDTKKLISDVYDLFANFIVNLVDSDLGKKLEKEFGIFKDIWSNITKNVEEFAKDLFSGKVAENLKTSFTKWWDNLKTIDVKKWFTDNIKPKISDAFSGTSIGAKIWANMRDIFRVNDVKKWFSTYITPKVKDAFSGTGIGSRIWSNMRSGFGDVKKWFTDNIVKKINSAISGISKSFKGGFEGSVKGILNKAIGYINDMLYKINKALQYIDKNLLPGDAIPSIKPIPKLAKGGITTGSTIANIGEAGREAVLPLENNTGWMDELASKLTSRMGSGAGGDIIVQVGGREIGRIAMNEIQKLQRQTGKPVLKM